MLLHIQLLLAVVVEPCTIRISFHHFGLFAMSSVFKDKPSHLMPQPALTVTMTNQFALATTDTLMRKVCKSSSINMKKLTSDPFNK